ncbi:MAG: hypothetical protein M1348_02375 [Candidatus Parvarchaeota archaeon]|nr:hypothetical protein [Candidatus Parvarchaeota archaeon]
MEKEEFRELCRRVLENFTLYNQYQNNVPYDRAYEISQMILRINNLAIKNGRYKGDLKTYLMDFEHKLQSEDRNRAVLFV